MKCAKCGGSTTVIDSRTSKAGATRRRRRCVECEARYTSFEVSSMRYKELIRMEKDYGSILEEVRRVLEKRGEQ